MWDAAQYLKFAGERARPFFDLLAQVDREHVRRAADLGCGPGELTRALADRWTTARVSGVDVSPEMLAKARPLAILGRLEFAHADLTSWQPGEPLDLIISNAALQWVGGHEALLPALVGLLAEGGTLAVQMPSHFDTPAQKTIDALVRCDRWRQKLAGVGLQPGAVRPLAWYVERLHDLGMTVNAWETTYYHVLTGEGPVLEWMKGTALRPLLSALEPLERDEFLLELGAQLAIAYPPRAGRTVYPFPRIFFVATRG